MPFPARQVSHRVQAERVLHAVETDATCRCQALILRPGLREVRRVVTDPSSPGRHGALCQHLNKPGDPRRLSACQLPGGPLPHLRPRSPLGRSDPLGARRSACVSTPAQPLTRRARARCCLQPVPQAFIGFIAEGPDRPGKPARTAVTTTRHARDRPQRSRACLVKPGRLACRPPPARLLDRVAPVRQRLECFKAAFTITSARPGPRHPGKPDEESNRSHRLHPMPNFRHDNRA